MVESFNRRYLYPRTLETDALKRGLFGESPGRADILVEGAASWDRPEFYWTFSGLTASKVLPADAASVDSLPKGPESATATGAQLHSLPASARVRFVRYAGPSDDDGYAVSGMLRDYTTSGGRITSVTLTDARVYVSSQRHGSFEPVLVGGKPYAPPLYTSPSVAGVDESALERIDTGDAWSLYSASGPIELQTAAP